MREWATRVAVRQSKELKLCNEGTLNARSSRCERVDDTGEVKRGTGIFRYERSCEVRRFTSLAE